MKGFENRIIDSHVHLDLLYKEDPGRIKVLQGYGCILISWAFGMRIERSRDLKDYMESQANVIRHLRRKGLDCFLLCGIHPRNIPQDLRAEDVEDLLLPFLEDPICLGIGEIGLETGSDQEKEVFEAHLELCRTLIDMGKRFGVHTPRGNKVEITNQVLSILDAHPGLAEITVVDHCTPETIGHVLEKGYWAGVTLSPIKTSLNELKRIVNDHPQDIYRIMCNTDSVIAFYEDLYALNRSKEFSPEVKIRLTFENAFQFFDVPSHWNQ
nr:hypothetical protein [Desulfobacterales bacterium]